MRGAEILDQMGNLFINEGFKGFTIGDLAARLQCSRRTLYEIAPNRTELVLIALDRRMRRIGRVGDERLRSAADPKALLEQYMLANQSEVYRATVRFVEDAASDPAVTRLLNAHFRYHVAVVRAILEYGIERGALRAVNTQVVAEAIGAALLRFMDPDFSHAAGDITFEDAHRELVSVFVSGLEVKPADGLEPVLAKERESASPPSEQQAARPA